MGLENKFIKSKREVLTDTYYLKMTEDMKERVLRVTQSFEFPTWLRGVIEKELPKIEQEIEKLD